VINSCIPELLTGLIKTFSLFLSFPATRMVVCGCALRVPLEKDNSEEFRQRELRAAQLAREIESSPQYRLRIAMENEDGRTEEEKHSAVQRQGSGRESPSLASR
jgi:hypothetical protein